ncbi:MAG TPA: glycoside hydrolase family 16 protein [Saliniramus sp.]|nr:glycoside hydrolase family 16 protein [Saliniramus sp.]
MSINPNNLSGTAKLTFSEEFDGNSLDSSVWETAYPWNAANGGTNDSNKEEQWYINSNYGPTAALAADTYQVEDGMLHIKAQPTPSQYKQDVNGFDYTSGMITTHDNFEQKYGYFEMRADIPSGKGMWPAFWLLQPNAWPPEIDVMEVIGDKPDELQTTVHYSDGGNKMLNETTYYPGLSDGFQTYGVNWQADTITWYLNGEKVHEVETPADLHDPMYMLVNLAVGGTWPGSPDGNTQFPATMSVDYIRAYSELPEGMAPPVSVPEEEVEEVVAEVVDEVVEENPVAEEDVAKDEAAEEEVAQEEAANDEAANDEAAEEEVAKEEAVAEDNEVEASDEDQEETAKVPDADEVVSETPDEVEEVEEVEQIGDAEEVAEAEEVEEPEEQVAEEEQVGEVEQVVEEKTPVEVSPETGNSGNSANWDKFIESFAGFGKNGSGNDGWSKFADKFAAKADKFSAKADEFAAKKAGIAEKMLARKPVESEDDASDVFGGFASAGSASGRDMSKIFQGNGFEVGNAKRDFGFQRMEAINDRIASFQEKGMGSQAQKFQDLDMGDFDWSKSFAEGISDQAVPQSVFDFA